MIGSRGVRFDLVTVLLALAGGIGVIWLAPLMVDQLVLFGDQEQTRIAAASRGVMLLPTALVIIGAIGTGSRVTGMHGVLAALPAMVAVPLALLLPERLLQLLAYAVTAPISLGALLSAAAPPPKNVRLPVVLVGVVLLVALTVLASPFTLMVLIGLIVWWRLPNWRTTERHGQETTVD